MQGGVMAVDVGTGSARVGIFDDKGRLLGRAEHPILMNRPLADHAEQSSADIWAAIGIAARRAVELAGLEPAAIRGVA